MYYNNKESFATLNVLLDSSRDIRPRDSNADFNTIAHGLANNSSILTMKSTKTKFGTQLGMTSESKMHDLSPYHKCGTLQGLNGL